MFTTTTEFFRIRPVDTNSHDHADYRRDRQELIGSPIYSDLFPVVRDLFETMSQDQLHCAGRWLFSDGQGNGTYVMPGEIDEVKGVKVIQSHPGNRERGLPRSVSHLTLYDKTTGLPLVQMDSTEITPIKTACESAVVLQQWEEAQGNTPIRLGLIGGGPNAEAHFEAFQQLNRAGVKSTQIYSPRTSGRVLAKKLSFTHPREDIRFNPDMDHLIESSNVIVSATTAPHPLITGRHIEQATEPKLFIILGFHDVSQNALMAANTVITDDPLEYTTQDHLPVGGYLRDLPPNAATLTDLVRGSTATLGASGTTIFAPFGLGTVDVAIGYHLYQQSQT